jgi:hypothetical protein
MKYNLVQRVFFVKKVKELKKISLVQRAFITEYPNDGTPKYSVIKNILSNFEKYGLVEHERKIPKIQLENMVSDFLNCQSGKRHLLLFRPHNCISDDLHLKPFKFHLWYKLEDQNYWKKAEFPPPPIGSLNSQGQLRQYAICSYEAYFIQYCL